MGNEFLVGNTPAVVTQRFTFCTYKKAGLLLDVALRQALGEAHEKLFLVDTAVMYGNQDDVAAILKDFPEVRVSSKVNRIGRVAHDLASLEALFPSSLHRVLLHRPMPLSDWRILEEAKLSGKLAEIGVCNYSIEKLQYLLEKCAAAVANCLTRGADVRSSTASKLATPLSEEQVKEVGRLAFRHPTVSTALRALERLVSHPALRRMEIGSNGLSDATLPLLLEVVKTAPHLQALTLGSYKSTDFFAGRHNNLTDAKQLAQVAAHVGFLNLSCGIEGQYRLGFFGL